MFDGNNLTINSLIILLVLCGNCRSFRSDSNDGSVRVNKCCEPNEILVDLRCANANESNQGKNANNYFLNVSVFLLKNVHFAIKLCVFRWNA